MDSSEKSLVHDLLCDPERGAAKLVDEYRELLYSIAYSLCHDHMMAEDLVFRTFECVIHNIASCRSEAAFVEWMKSILRNEWRMSVRRGMVRATTPEGGPDDLERLAGPGIDGDEAIVSVVDGEFVREAIETLSPEAREVLSQHYFLGMSLDQIARFLRLPIGTVKSRIHYARLSLASRLRPGGRGVAAFLAALLLFGVCSWAAVVGGRAVLVAAGVLKTAPSAETEVSASSFPSEVSPTDTTFSQAASTEADRSPGAISSGEAPASSNLPSQPTDIPDIPSPTDTMQPMKTSSLLPVVAFAALTPLTVVSDDYTLPAGQTDTFSDKAVHTYETVTIAGDLAILNETKFTATTAVNLAGGTVVVNGNFSAFGHRANRNLNPGVTATLSPAADSGRYTKVILQNGVNYGFSVNNVTDYANFGAKKLLIEAETEASRTAYPDGTFDFLEMTGSGGVANFCEVENQSSLTGRVHVAATSSMFGCGNGNANGAGFFKTGDFLLDVDSGKTLRFNANDKGYSYNQAGCNVLATGAGNLLFIQRYNVTWIKTALRSGAVLDVTGTITFDCSSTTAGAYGWFSFSDSNVFGPNVGKIMTADVVGKNHVFLEVPTGVAVTVHDVEIKREGDCLIGAGTVRIDATGAARTFEANIPATYGSGNVNTLTVVKTGANEAELVISNVPSLVVEQGVARITSDCVIGSLSGAAGATLVADGCTVTLPEGVVLDGLNLDTANGGAFQSRSSRTVLYAPATLDGTLHVAGGNLAFSNFGLSQKYMRWTFLKTKTSPNPLQFSKLWVFGVDGSHVATGLTAANDNTTADLAAGQVCWEYSSKTNIANQTSNYWEGKGVVYKMFSDELTSNQNNYPRLASPVIDPENPDSWVSIALRRKDGEANATGYNMRIANHIYSPSSWTVEASDDGQIWTQVDARTDVTPAKTTWWSFYDGKVSASANDYPIEHFIFTGYKSNGLAADAAKTVTLQVDEGASVDLTAFSVAPQKIGGIVFDYTEGGGTVQGGAIAPDGTLTILNGAGNFAIGVPLPLTLTGVVDADNLRSWSLFVDGSKVTGGVRLNRDGHLVVVAFGSVVYFR